MSGRLALCTDSSAHVAAGDGLAVVPVTVVVDGEPFDEPELELDRFYDLLDGGARVSTSQPSPGRFAEAYARAAAAGAAEVVSLHLDARASGTAGSAELAAREAPLPVTVAALDTVGYGVGRAVAAAAAAARAGGGAAQVVGRARATAAGLRTAFAAAGAPGGRLPQADGLLLLTVRDGSTAVLGASAGPEEAVESLARELLADGVPAFAAVGHAHPRAAAPADALAALLADAGVGELDRYRVAPSVGAHVGPDCSAPSGRRPPRRESVPSRRASDGHGAQRRRRGPRRRPRRRGRRGQARPRRARRRARRERADRRRVLVLGLHALEGAPAPC